MSFNFRGRYLPVLLLTGLLLLSLDFDLEKQLELIKSSSLALAGCSLLIIFMRTLSTFLYEELYFDKRRKFPTTKILLEETEYSELLRKALIARGYIGMSTLEELPRSIRQLTNDYRENKIVKSANIDYSFARNFSGGVLLLIIVQVSALFFLEDKARVYMFLGAEGVFFLFSFVIVHVIAKKYAEALFTEFLKDVRNQ